MQQMLMICAVLVVLQCTETVKHTTPRPIRRNHNVMTTVPAGNTSTSTTRLPTTTTPETFVPFRHGQFGLKKHNGQYCLLADFEARIVISTIGSTDEFISNIEPDAKLDGQCASESEESTAELSLQWTDQENRRHLTTIVFASMMWFNKITEIQEHWWKLANASYVMVPPRQKEPSIVASMGRMALGAVQDQSPSGINAPMPQALYCRHTMNITMTVNETTNATLQLRRELLLQPFGVHKGGVFGTRHVCEESRRVTTMEELRSTATIATGCMLGLFSVGMVVAYALKKRFLRKVRERTQYQAVS